MNSSTQILKTKLYVPPRRPDVISRTRLLSRLDEGLRLQRKLTLVAAAAGFGKTTLVSDWIASGERRTGWLSLDAGDNDPVRCMTHLIAALQTIEPNVGREQQALLGSSPPVDAAGVVPGLINEIAETMPPFTLVLDDYHLIGEQSIHGVLIALLEHMPPTMHLVLLTRADPPLPLARLRVRDQLTELRAADLRFTPEEAARFLNERMGLALTPATIAALEARTEGWIAGLQLAALSLRGETEVASFVDSFAGSDRYVLDYLMEEVLARQSDTVQDFLLCTAILERLTGALCDAVTQRSDGRETLARLEENNLFVVPLDNRRDWYRYHGLFADLLRFRLQSERPQEICGLHLRASDWYAEHGFTAEAVHHALAAAAWERAADLLEAAVPVLVEGGGHIRTLLEWYGQLPPSILAARPTLNLYYAWLLADTSHFEAAEQRLRQLEADDSRAVAYLIPARAAIRSQMALSQGRTGEAVAQAEEALAQMPDEEPSLWRNMAVLSLMFGSYLSGDLRRARQALTQLPPLGEHPSATQLLVGGLGGLVLATQGEHDAAAGHFRHILQHAALDDQGDRLHPQAGLAQIGLGQIYLAWNRLEEAAPLIESGLRLSEQTQNVITLSQGHRVLLNLRWAQGDRAGFDAALQRVGTMEETFRSEGLWLANAIEAYRRRLEAIAGRLDGLEAWLAAHRAERPDGVDADAHEMAYGAQLQEMSFARVLIAVGEAHQRRGLLAEAATVLRQLIALAERQALHNIQLRSWLYLARAAEGLGQRGEALAALERAVALAAPAGIVRQFLDEGEPVRQLLQALSERPDAPVFTATLMDAFGTPSPSAPAGAREPQQANQQLVEPLTERELDVLQLLAEGHTNGEIAAQLTVTVGTVKSHAKRIYGKLSVGNRTEAAARARELGLV